MLARRNEAIRVGRKLNDPFLRRWSCSSEERNSNEEEKPGRENNTVGIGWILIKGPQLKCCVVWTTPPRENYRKGIGGGINKKKDT